MTFNGIKLDQTDKKILSILQANGKITNAQLAKEIGLSAAPTLERVKKLENSGIIQSYHAILDRSKIGLGVSIFVQASLSASRKELMKSFEKKINDIPEIVECFHVTGSSDFILKVLIDDINSYNDFIQEKLIGIDEIGNIQSMVVLNVLKDSKVLPV